MCESIVIVEVLGEVSYGCSGDLNSYYAEVTLTEDEIANILENYNKDVAYFCDGALVLFCKKGEADSIKSMLKERKGELMWQINNETKQ